MRSQLDAQCVESHYPVEAERTWQARISLLICIAQASNRAFSLSRGKQRKGYSVTMVVVVMTVAMAGVIRRDGSGVNGGDGSGCSGIGGGGCHSDVHSDGGDGDSNDESGCGDDGHGDGS